MVLRLYGDVLIVGATKAEDLFLNPKLNKADAIQNIWSLEFKKEVSEFLCHSIGKGHQRVNNYRKVVFLAYSALWTKQDSQGGGPKIPIFFSTIQIDLNNCRFEPQSWFNPNYRLRIEHGAFRMPVGCVTAELKRVIDLPPEGQIEIRPAAKKLGF